MFICLPHLQNSFSSLLTKVRCAFALPTLTMWLGDACTDDLGCRLANAAEKSYVISRKAERETGV